MLDWDKLSEVSVLIVDDEPDNAEVVATVLRFNGASVWTALNGQEAMQYLADNLPDLVLLDLSMPQMDGWVMLIRLRADPRLEKLPVVALSAHAMQGDRERVLAAGFDGYLSKPVNIPSFLTDLRRTLEQTRQVPVELPKPGLPPTPSANGSAPSMAASKEAAL